MKPLISNPRVFFFSQNTRTVKKTRKKTKNYSINNKNHIIIFQHFSSSFLSVFFFTLALYFHGFYNLLLLLLTYVVAHLSPFAHVICIISRDHLLSLLNVCSAHCTLTQVSLECIVYTPDRLFIISYNTRCTSFYYYSYVTVII